MGYCGPKGIPLSVFLGWSQADQDAALAWQTHEGRRCRRCGHHPDEGQPHAHVDVCPGCVQVDRLSNADESKVRGGHVHLAGGLPGDCERCVRVIEANRRG